MVGSILSYLGPTPPDFDFCDDFYGTPLLAHCGQVLELMPRGTNPVLYNNEPITADTGSPFRIGAFYDTGKVGGGGGVIVAAAAKSVSRPRANMTIYHY